MNQYKFKYDKNKLLLYEKYGNIPQSNAAFITVKEKIVLLEKKQCV